ncbi:MAG: hypothetical protein ACE5G0_03080 [Rhodothermales bacterium]
MEQKKEIAKLVNVLRRTARMARQARHTGTNDDAASFCVEQYNRVLARLIELDQDTAPLFEPLAPDASLTVVALACRQLAAYYEEDVDWVDMRCLDIPLPCFSVKVDCC